MLIPGQILRNNCEHTGDRKAWLKKGVGDEFRREILVALDRNGPLKVRNDLEVKYGPGGEDDDPDKYARIPSEEKIISLSGWHSSSKSLDLTIEDMAGMRAFTHDKMLTTKAQFDALGEKDNETLQILGTFEKDVVVEVEEYDKTTKKTTIEKQERKALGFVAATRLQLLVLLQICLSGELVSIDADGTYKLHNGGWTTVDAGTHDVAWKKHKFTHMFFQLIYMFCFTECYESYLFLFQILDAIPPTLFGLPEGSLKVAWGGLDRTSYIADAFLAVWSTIVLLQCWAHISRKVIITQLLY